MNLLEAHGLTRKMGDVDVLDRVDMQVSSGEIVAVCGGNGVGKTTLLRCLAGRLHPSSGSVLWSGQSPHRCHQAHRLLGFASHESHLYQDLTVRENLLFAVRMFGVPRARERTAQVLKTTELDRWANQPAGRLSKGTRQRVSIARALIHDPPIVILDEPFAGLDIDGRVWLEAWFSELRSQDRAICFTSHDEAQCSRLADRRLELRAGKLIRNTECLSLT